MSSASNGWRGALRPRLDTVPCSPERQCCSSVRLMKSFRESIRTRRSIMSSMSSTAPCHVFAYGSNLFTERMVRRVPSAQVVGPATLPGHRLTFRMRSPDGSGKADAAPSATRDDRVEGVIYRIHPVHLAGLDRVEGGYLRRVHRFRCEADGVGLEARETEGLRKAIAGAVSEIRAWTYHARPERVEPEMQPFRWYHELVVEGARSHGLPPAYVEGLEGVPALPS